MTTTENTPSKPDLAPWLRLLPASARAEAAAAYREASARRAALAVMSPAERAAEVDKEYAARAAEAKAEMLAERADQRWSMWCHQVPAIYRDDRADCDVRVRRDYGWWLSRLAPEQYPAEIARWLADPESRTLWLMGNTGTGKTHAAISAGYAAAAASVHARYVSQLDYLQQLRPGVSDNPTRVRERYETTSLLVLDDFGAETGDASQFVRQELLNLLDERLSQGRRQIITTNSDATELRATFGDRIMDRLAASASGLRYEGESRRKARDLW